MSPETEWIFRYHRCVGIMQPNTITLTILLIAGCSSSKRDSPSDKSEQGSAAPNTNAPKVEPESKPLKRIKPDWRGIDLGANEARVRDAARAIDFVPECEAKADGSIDLYSFEGNFWTNQDKIPVVVCRLRSPAYVEENEQTMQVSNGRKPKPPRHEKKGVATVVVTLVKDKAYAIDIDFFDGEPYEGLAKNMTEAFGPPTWSGTLRQVAFNRVTGEKSEPTFPAKEWADDVTVVHLYNVVIEAGIGAGEYPKVRYLNFALLPEIKPLQDAAVNPTPTPPPASTATF